MISGHTISEKTSYKTGDFNFLNLVVQNPFFYYFIRISVTWHHKRRRKERDGSLIEFLAQEVITNNLSFKIMLVHCILTHREN